MRGRIILPLFDPTGNLIAIGSRSINNQFQGLPVYWHESYEKPYYLYGINLARSFLRRHNFCILTEGQFDVLQLHAHGVKNVVGLCGNKMSDVQMSVIHRYCSDIVLLLDTDANQAGQIGAAKITSGNQSSLRYDNSRYRETLDRKGMSFPSPISIGYADGFCSNTRPIISATFPENSDPDSFVRKYGIDELKKIVQGKLHELRNRTSGH